MNADQLNLINKLTELRSLIQFNEYSRGNTIPFISSRRAIDHLPPMVTDIQRFPPPLFFPFLPNHILPPLLPTFMYKAIPSFNNIFNKTFPKCPMPLSSPTASVACTLKLFPHHPIIPMPLPRRVFKGKMTPLTLYNQEEKTACYGGNIMTQKMQRKRGSEMECEDIDDSKTTNEQGSTQEKEMNDEINIDVINNDSKSSILDNTIRNDESAWHDNMLSRGNKEGVFYCHICEYKGNQQEGFLAHLRGHYDYKCDKCDYASRTEGRLKRHIKDFHSDVPPENFSGQKTIKQVPKCLKCKHCNFVSDSKDQHWRHQRLHLQPNKYLECPKCPFITEYKHHLEYHIRNHVGSKPYKCPKCNYQCVNKSMLNSHMKSHTSVYQYRCADCNYATKYCHSLKLHLLKQNHIPASVLNPDGSLPAYDNSAEILSTKRGPHARGILNNSTTANDMLPSLFTHSLFNNTSTNTKRPFSLIPGMKLSQHRTMFNEITESNSNFGSNSISALPNNLASPTLFTENIAQALVLDLTSKQIDKKFCSESSSSITHHDIRNVLSSHFFDK